MKNHRVAIGLSALMLVLAACGSSESADTTTEDVVSTTAAQSSETTEAADTETSDMATLAVASTELGDVLVDDAGFTLYMFVPDEQDAGVSTCEGDCLANWPALGEVEAGDGVDASLIGTIERSDGSTQATYNGWPLYYFALDEASGDTNGQAVNDVWFVMAPDGSVVGMTETN